MKGYLVLLALFGVATSAPQNWPYRDSLMPYRYGYPSQSQYKYLPQIEDDEEIGPYFQMGRQDFVVGSDGDRVIPTPETPSVVETGSVAPVNEANKIPTTAIPPPTPKVPSPPPPKPVGGESGSKPVQPPPFPPARPPPPPRRPVEKEDEDEDEDDDESDEDDNDADDQHTDDDGDDNDGDQDDDDEDDRRRQEPISKEEVVEKEKEKTPVVKSDKVTKSKVTTAPVAPPAPVVVSPKTKPVATKTVVKSSSAKQPTTSVDENEEKPVVDSNEVAKPNEADDESSEEQGLEDDGVEALVPGYVTDQGEVLVPVDTVTGDQPISIVPDPYTPPRRGVPHRNTLPTYRRSPYDELSYNNPYYYYPGVARQDDADESEEEEEDDEVPSNNESEEGDARNEILTDFPPARTPELYAVIKSRIPAQQSSSEEVYGPQQGYNVPYQPVYQSQRPQPQEHQVSLAVSLSNKNSAQYGGRPQVPSYPGFNRYQVPYASPYMRNPYGYYRVPAHRPQSYGPYYRRPGPAYPYYGGFRPQPPVFRRPPYNPYGYGSESYGQYTPVLIKRNPYPGVKKPVGPGKKPQQGVRVKTGPVVIRRPTPVEYQDEEPYPYEQPMPYPYPQGIQYDSAPTSSEETNVRIPVELDTSSQESSKVIQNGSTTKTRRAAKMTKKFEKKSSMKQKKVTDPDPLNILKKISMKRS